ncbi:hypothetical protein AX16_003952 [Volvariella volvacea WC 439]|nr:hypothetical protein AX16_003952 [Volvariella volvacea WC 439]
MAGLNFSWSDTLRATFSPCLPCLVSSHSSPSTDSLLDSADAGTRNTNLESTRNTIRRARPDELQGLLNDPITDDDDHDYDEHTRDLDTLSLHSNIGLDNSRRGRGRGCGGRGRGRGGRGGGKASEGGGRRSITFFGFDLFGRRKPAIQLPEDEPGSEDPLHRSLAPGPSSSLPGQDATAPPHPASGLAPGDESEGGLQRRDSWGATTLLTFDSDASPLDLSMIDSMTQEQIDAHIRAAEEDRIAKEERRRKRREKKQKEKEQLARRLEMEREMEMDLDDELLRAGAAGRRVEDGFEGFQGSAEGGPLMYAPEEYGKFAKAVISGGRLETASSTTSSSSSSSARKSKHSHPQPHRPSPLSLPSSQRPHGTNGGEDATVDGDVDFDGNLYNTRPMKHPTSASRSGSDLDSRSRTSASNSQAQYASYPHPHGHGHGTPLRSGTKKKKSKSSSNSITSPIPASASTLTSAPLAPQSQSQPHSRHRSTKSRSSASSTTMPQSPPPIGLSSPPPIAEAGTETELGPGFGLSLDQELPTRIAAPVEFEGYPIESGAGVSVGAGVGVGGGESGRVKSDFPMIGFGRSGSRPGFGSGFGSSGGGGSGFGAQRTVNADASSDGDGHASGRTARARADVGMAAMLARRGEF